ncbi:MAG: hypothetical protein ACXVGF_22150 [Blastococcus sp.]
MTQIALTAGGLLLLAGCSWGVGATAAPGTTPTAPAPVSVESMAKATLPNPYRMATRICSASQAAMENWITVARQAYPDAEGFADFLGYQANAIDENCPSLRPTYDAATSAIADVRLGTHP